MRSRIISVSSPSPPVFFAQPGRGQAVIRSGRRGAGPPHRNWDPCRQPRASLALGSGGGVLREVAGYLVAGDQLGERRFLGTAEVLRLPAPGVAAAGAPAGVRGGGGAPGAGPPPPRPRPPAAPRPRRR